MEALNKLPNLNATSLGTQDTIALALRSHETLAPTLRLETSFNNDFWAKFEKYLINNYDRKTIYDRLSYAKKYYHVLAESNAQDLLSLNLDKQKHAMKALAVLSKYLGCYERWKQIKQSYQLKWSNGDSLQYFENFFDGTKSYSVMVDWLRTTCDRLPKQYSNVLLYCTLTGLRAEEACRSVNLLQTDLDRYLNRKSLILEHFRYPSIFIRRTKKAYVSIVTEKTLEIGRNCANLSYSGMNCYLRRHGIEMKMKDCRKIFSSHLRNSGFQPEVIDLLQGRVPKTVFARHYNRPDFTPIEIRSAIDSLYDTIVS